MITRRTFSLGLAMTGTAAGLSGAQAAGSWLDVLPEAFRRIEAGSGGRLGVMVLDTGIGAKAGHRADELFPLCSTFKFLAAAAVLARVDRGGERLDRRIPFQASDLVTYSPRTESRVGGTGMTLEELCEAAMVVSDNTAGNLLLGSIGGPTGITALARSLGDDVTRLDRIEPHLNEALAGDPRDTTSPAAMADVLRALVLGETALKETSRERLKAWLLGNQTGATRLRAGLPADWRIGEKTGTGDNGTSNDVGIIWPPGRPPLVITAYLTGSTASADSRNGTLAEVARAVAGAAAAAR
ncbi:class A beta-lactamase [uncultured Enterovirga sp.]|uniref:class A beta-lactamase n=1 Tax=uncultured Enterovirga sp. TaxID=2026352 RepID=UPI0035CB0867